MSRSVFASGRAPYDRIMVTAAMVEIPQALLDRLEPNGVLIAHNEGRRGVPMVFTCPREPGPVRLVLKARGLALAGIFGETVRKKV